MRPARPFLLAPTALLLFALPAAAQDDAELITSAESAAPAALAANATIHAMGEDGAMRILREGTNGWWCMPDDPNTPGADPMCGDANSMEWAMSWLGKTEPPEGKVGFIYMLTGGTDASNTDPYATEPTEGGDWISSGPHVMVVNAMDMMDGYPEDAVHDTSQPFVMWAGTPYSHLMLPVE